MKLTNWDIASHNSYLIIFDLEINPIINFSSFMTVRDMFRHMWE